MLALIRRVNEEIVIGDPAKPLGVIRVVSVHGDKVRLSFDFPRDVKINRRELAELKKQMTSEDESPEKEEASWHAKRASPHAGEHVHLASSFPCQKLSSAKKEIMAMRYYY